MRTRRYRRYPPSDGEKHENLALPVVIAIIITAGFLAFVSPALTLGLCMGALCAYFIDPDLDQRDATRAENRIYRMNKILGAIFHMYFIPYSLIPHRSVLSHGGKNKLTGWIGMVLIATPLRILYTHAWLLIYLPLERFRTYIAWIPPFYWLGLYVAWAIVDCVHWLRDTWLN